MNEARAFQYLEKEELMNQSEQLRVKYKTRTYGELANPRTLELFRKYLPKGGKILDLGSSNGLIFTVLKKAGFHDTHGADISNLLTLDTPTGTFNTFDFSTDRFPYEDSTFDGITSIEVIEHLENPYHFLRECARILKPHGILVLSTPNSDHLYNRISFFVRGKFYRFLDGNDHIMLFAHYILTKGALKYFTLVAKEYMFGQFPYRIFTKLRYPENKWFGSTAFYIFSKK